MRREQKHRLPPTRGSENPGPCTWNDTPLPRPPAIPAKRFSQLFKSSNMFNSNLCQRFRPQPCRSTCMVVMDKLQSVSSIFRRSCHQTNKEIHWQDLIEKLRYYCCKYHYVLLVIKIYITKIHGIHMTKYVLSQ